MTEHPKEPTRVAAGLKAAIHNRNVSDEARERATVRLKEMGHEVEDTEEPQQTSPSRVLDPHASSDTKKNTEEVLEAAGIRGKHPDHTDEQHFVRVAAGYKAALRNSRVSEESKQYARDFLKEHNIKF